MEVIKKLFKTNTARRVVSIISGILMISGGYLFIRYYLPPMSQFFSFYSIQSYLTIIFFAGMIMGVERIFFAATGSEKILELFFGEKYSFMGLRYMYTLIVFVMAIVTIISSIVLSFTGLMSGLGLLFLGLDLWYS
ncbi:hypothetical protein HS7_07960 [Sulfolobales archaeon HS-7]|nr:hypothetical protein HS7_07960 [Sulfolobales archaeon HS-7]